MFPVLKVLKAAMSRRVLKWLAAPAALAVVVGVVIGQVSPPNIPTVALSSEPLYAQGARAKPTLTLALSVEFPTVGAQYLNSTYLPTDQYLGYFDSESCYVYNNTPSEQLPAGAVQSDYKRFDLFGPAVTAPSGNPRSCVGVAPDAAGNSTAFSGNFLNWATASAIDILRYGLTGGDRIVDTPSLTVLQRAVIPGYYNTFPGSFWNGANFPAKVITYPVSAEALPKAMLGNYQNPVWIGNCLSQFSIGTFPSGTCVNPGQNADLTTTAPSQVAPSQFVTQNVTGPLPASFSGYPNNPCSGEYGFCAFTGVAEVAYGANNSWIYVPAANGITCSNTMSGSFIDPAPNVVKSCFIRPYASDPAHPFQTWQPNYTGLTQDGFFYARASVCSSSGLNGANLQDPRTSLCLRYPAGNFKPVGNLQLYSDRVRIAAFGYLNDSTGAPSERYGGVLRAPMKYVGPTAYNQNFTLIAGPNPNQEWDSATGVFLANPDNNQTIRSGATNNGPYLSGVTNYLNQFGRTGTPGTYKVNDPVSELYYESLRYIQGLPPAPQATYGMTTAMKDGFPVTTNWVDPHPPVLNTASAPSTTYSYACVNNNILAIGDDNTNDDKSIPGNVSRLSNEDVPNVGFPGGRPANLPNNEPDFYFWTKVVGGFESNTPVSYTDGRGLAQTTGNNPNVNPARWGMENQNAGNDSSYFMAGMAYWANTHDIRGATWTAAPSLQRIGMRVKSYMLDVNEYNTQANAGSRHNNQFFLAAKYGGFAGYNVPAVNAAANTPNLDTGNPFQIGNNSYSNSPWQDPANPGEASTYYLSSSSGAVLKALNDIFYKIATQSNSVAGAAVSTQQLNVNNSAYTYVAQFDAGIWTGDLTAYAVTMGAGGTPIVSPTAAWDAKTQLAAKNPAARNIVVGKAVPIAGATATDFSWNSVDPNVQTALETPPYAAPGAPLDPASTGLARLTYLRGDRSNESPNGLNLRPRTAVLGDIVNSGVAYSGAPANNITDAAYGTFASTYATRKHALFVGANDGMLHAFDANNGTVPNSLGGDELFAYIPSWVVPRLAALTSSSYVHQSYVDGTPAVQEALVGNTWRTVLVSGTGAGGQGVFALDVSDPAAFSASSVLWEFTDRDDPDMGNVIGRPQILKLRTSASNVAPTYKYFAVVASGVNNYANDGYFSSTGYPAIFLLDLSKASGSPWTLGTNYFKVSFPPFTPAAAAITTATGMVGFSVLPGNSGEVSALFAGDLHGNLWKLDFSKATSGTSGWNLGALSYYKNSNGTPIPMYIATDASGARQPITMEPALIYGANRSLIVSFGTGKFLEVSDTVAPFQTQSVYSILDDNTATNDSASATAAISGRLRLMQGQDVINNAGNATVNVPTFVWGRTLIDNDPSNLRSGWYFDFGSASTGERQVSGFNVVGGQLNFASIIPAASNCDPGSGRLYVVPVDGGTPGNGYISTVGILGQPLLFDLGVAANSTTALDTTGQYQQKESWGTLTPGSGGQQSLLLNPTNAYLGRLSWREVTNYQCVKNSPATGPGAGVCN